MENNSFEWKQKSFDTNGKSLHQIVVISRAQGNKIGMGLSNQTTFCGEKKKPGSPANL